LPAYQLVKNESFSIKTGQTPYNWAQQLPIFVKQKDNLVVYEVLIRDFDATEIIKR
jgi:hypothetical protein